MSLRVPIWVNDVKLGEVEILRTFTNLTGPGVHRYAWYLRTWTSDGRRHVEASIIDHREADGALVLIRKALQACEGTPLHKGPA